MSSCMCCTTEWLREGYLGRQCTIESDTRGTSPYYASAWTKRLGAKREVRDVGCKKISTRMSTYLKDRRNVCTREYADDGNRTRNLRFTIVVHQFGTAGVSPSWRQESNLPHYLRMISVEILRQRKNQ